MDTVFVDGRVIPAADLIQPQVDPGHLVLSGSPTPAGDVGSVEFTPIGTVDARLGEA